MTPRSRSAEGPVTHVRLARSGGFAGLSLVASVDVDDLPPDTAAAVRAAVEQVDFSPPTRSSPRRGAADMFQYDLVVTGGRRRTLTAHDPLVDPGLRALADALLPLAVLE